MKSISALIGTIGLCLCVTSQAGTIGNKTVLVETNQNAIALVRNDMNLNLNKQVKRTLKQAIQRQIAENQTALYIASLSKSQAPQRSLQTGE